MGTSDPLAFRWREYITENQQAKSAWDDFGGGVALHRLGGYSLPSSSASAARGNVAAGCAFLDADMRLTADGVPVLAHDYEVGTGTNLASGTWREQQSAMIGSVRWQPSRTLGGRWPDLDVSTIAEFLDEFGGRIPILIEPKNQTALSDWKTSIAALAPLILSRGLERSVMVGMSAQNLPTHASVVKEAGLMLQAYLVSNHTDHDSPAVIPEYLAAGVDIIALSSMASDATVTAWLNSGIPVMVSPSGRRWRWAELKALGVQSCIDDYAIYTAGLNATTRVAPWANGQWGTGDIPASGHNRPKLLTSGLKLDSPASSYQCMLAGDFAPLPVSCVINFEVSIDTDFSAATGSWFGLQVATSTDASWRNAEANPGGYTCMIAPMTGRAAIWQRVNSANNKRAESGTSAAIGKGGTLYGRVTLNSSGVTVERLSAANGSVMTTCTYADATYRGGYLHVGGFFSANSGSYTVKSLTVTAI